MTDAEMWLAVMEWHDRENALFAEQWEQRAIELSTAIIEAAESQKTTDQQGPASP
jgi:hypothetical protein